MVEAEIYSSKHLCKSATITSIDQLTYATCKNMAEYRSKYYTLKASIKKQSITIEKSLKIRRLNNLRHEFKTYLTVDNDRMQNVGKLGGDNVLFKAIQEEETRIKADPKASANFASTKSNTKPQDGAAKRKKSLLSGLNVGNVPANIWLTRYLRRPMKIVKSVTRGDIFLASMTVTFLSINEKLQKDPPRPARTQKKTLPGSHMW